MADLATLDFGLDTFGDIPVDDTGAPVTDAAAIRQVVEEAVLADQIGVNAIALGEHHRPEYSISSPETVLAGIATKTSNLKLGSGVTVLSSDDPVRVFQRFATLDAIARGRAEVILGSHNASNTTEAIARTSALAVRNLLAGLDEVRR